MEQYSRHIKILGHGAKIFVSVMMNNIHFLFIIFSFAVTIKFCSSHSCFSRVAEHLSDRHFRRLNVLTMFVLFRISAVYQTRYYLFCLLICGI